MKYCTPFTEIFNIVCFLIPRYAVKSLLHVHIATENYMMNIGC